MNATTLELFFIDGSPNGMLTAQIFGWTGHILVTPRTRLSEALKRKESSHTGVYILLEEESDEKPLAYIGQGENIANRIKRHELEKEWWTKAVLITSTANDLHTAHAQYIEAKLVEKCKEAKNTELKNNTNPQPPSLPEATQVNMEKFIAQLLMVLPAIRVDIFASKAKQSGSPVTTRPHPHEDNLVFELRSAWATEILRDGKPTATAILENSKFVVQAGSKAKKEYTSDHESKSSDKKLHKELIKEEIIIEQDGYMVFTKDYEFNSPSAAGAVCNGRSTNGRIEWKVQGKNQTYKAWEAEKLAENHTTTLSQV